ncbi:MAG: hypothetical protein Q8R57_03475 [Bacteroidota bacterium]|nr:hypothetical protein [Bacteroidota bacterium]
MKYILFLLSPLCLFTPGCKSEEETYTITGKIVKSCDYPTPVSNLSFELWYYSDSKRNDALKASGVTDIDGNFSIQYTSTPNGFNSRMELITSNGPFGQKPILSRIPQNKNMAIGNIYTDTNYYMIVKIKTENNFSDLDTLYYNIIKPYGQYDFLIGPFYNNQIIDTI